MGHDDPDFLPRHVVWWGVFGTVGVAVAALIFTAWLVDYRSTVAAPPGLTASVTDGATSQALDVALALDSDAALASATVVPQWRVRAQGPVASLTDVQCVGSTCYATGSGGQTGEAKLSKSTDSGVTWTAQAVSQIFSSDGLFVVDANTAYVAGVALSDLSKRVYKTTDGGTTWTAGPAIVSGAALADLSCVSGGTTCWGVGASGLIVKTTDGGTTWTAQTAGSGYSGSFYAVYCVDANTCYATGVGGEVQKTTDGGTTWVRQTSGEGNDIRDVSCSDANTCVAVDSFSTTPIWRTTNGGTTWTRSASPAVASSTVSLRSVTFADANTGWIVTGDNGSNSVAANIFKTTDGGATWSLQTTVSAGVTGLVTVHALDANTLVAASTDSLFSGQNGYSAVFRSTNGGATWTQQSGPVDRQLVALDCVDASTCAAVGFGSALMVTTDGGVTWVAPTFVATFPLAYLEDVDFVNSSTGWAVGRWAMDNSARIYKTTNGGTSWTQVSYSQQAGTPSFWLYGVSCVDSSTCIAVGRNGVIVKTTDGTNWSAQATGPSQQLNAVRCVDATTCYGVGAGGSIYKTTDGGATWSTQTTISPASSLERVTCVDANTCWVVGASGVIRKTTDGGTTWSSQTSGTTLRISDISCANASTCWAAASDLYTYSPQYSILFTTDGGTTWSVQSTANTTNLNAIAATSSFSAVVVGDNGNARTYSENVRLQTNTGNTQAGAPTGSTLCTSVSLGNDGSGNANRRITCAHANLSAGTWYTLTATTGITNSSNEALASNFTRTFQTATPPALSTASVTDGATGQAITVALTMDFDAALAGATVTTSNITLQTNTGNTQAGAGTGSNLCTAVSLGNDGSGNANRRITCTHGNLSGATWYTLTATTGVTSVTLAPLAANATRVFKTVSGPAVATASLADGATSQDLTVPLTLDFDVPLASATVTTTNVTLQTNTGNTQGGAPTGSNLCAAVLLEADGDGNANRRITCDHAALTATTWYTLTVTTGVTGTNSVPLSANITRAFQTLTPGPIVTAMSVTDGANNQPPPVPLTVDVTAPLAPLTVAPGWTLNAVSVFFGFNDMHLVSATTGYVVGTAGKIAKTTDGGATWSQQASGLGVTSAQLTDITCTDANTCWAVGTTGKIVKTTNGGTIWSSQTSGTTNTLSNITCADANTCWIVGSSNTLRKTTDGGTTWAAQTSGAAASVTLSGITCTDANTCWIVGSSNTLRKTTDGGTTWAAQTSGLAATTALNDVVCTDANTCWIVGSGGAIRKTTNGGTSWAAQTSGTTSAFNDITCTDASTCVAVGGAGLTAIVHWTTDGGATWTAGTGASGTVLSNVTCGSASVCLTVGTTRSFKSTDGGLTWANPLLVTAQILYDLSFPTATTGWVVGGAGTILKTIDSGTTWTAQTSGTTNILNDIACMDATMCIAVGGAGTTSVIRKTTDGGATWIAQTPGVSVVLNSIACPNANTCVVVGASGVILKTTDGGTTWSVQTSGTTNTLAGVTCTDANTCGVVGSVGVILKTTNGGTTWFSQTSGTTNTLTSIACVNPSTCWVVGYTNTILKTTNGGMTWFSQTSGLSSTAVLSDIACANTTACWIAANSGVLIQTVNGGATWANQVAPPWGATTLVAIQIPAGGSMRAVGSSGTIISLPRPTSVLLQANTPNAQGGTPSGTNQCITAIVGSDGAGNSNRRITCVHPNLPVNQWHTLTVTTGITDTTGAALAAGATRSFGVGNAPSLTGANVNDLAVGRPVNLTPTFEFDAPLAANTVTTSTLVLQEMGARLSGSASGSNLCSSVAVGGGNQSASCTPTSLRSGRWYSMQVVGGDDGIQSSASLSLGSTTTRRFKTAYAPGDRETIAHADLSNMFTEGWFNRTGSADTAATKITAAPEVVTTTTVSSSTATVTVPQNAEITKADGGTFDATAFTMAEASLVVTNVNVGSVKAAIQYGVPGTRLTVTSPVTISIPVPAGTVDGAILEVYRSPDPDFSDDTTPATTCTVSSGMCTFTTTGLSYFTVVEPAGSPRSTDTTPPAAPTSLAATSTQGRVTLTWRDPTDSDLLAVRILLLDGDQRIVRGTVARGIQRFTDPAEGLTIGRSYTFAVQAIDTTENRSPVTGGVAVTLSSTPSAGASAGTAPVSSETAPASPPAVVAPSTEGSSSAESPPSTTGEEEGLDSATPQGGSSVSTPPGGWTSPSSIELLIRSGESPPPSFPWSEIRPTLPPFPCTLTDSQQALAAYAFSLTQGVFPSTPRDLEVACNLFIDPRNPTDITVRFPEYRRFPIEEFSLKNFVNFFLRPPSRTFRNEPTTAEIAAGDWWVVKYMAYHLHLLPTFRNTVSERRCTRLFIDRDVDLYKQGGVKIRKPAGRPPVDTFDFDFIRACAYSGAAFPGGR